MLQFTLKSIEDLEKDAISLEARLQSSSSDSDVDFKTLSASLTGSRTQLVTLHTQAESLTNKIERVVLERRKRINEIKRYQSLLIDLEQWLGEAQATLTTEIRLTSVQIVRDQIRASEVRPVTLRVRSQLNNNNIYYLESGEGPEGEISPAGAPTEGGGTVCRVH